MSITLVTGAAGMVGRALVDRLKEDGHHVLAIARKECDLEDRKAVAALFQKNKPKFVYHLAAKVGGIRANIADPVHFLQSNALIGCHVLEAAHAAGVEKILMLGSSCIYPRECPQPMREEYLLTGPLEPTNEGYAIGKIVSLKLAQYYHSQYGLRVVCPIPSNIYGPGDTFDLDQSHVLSALVRRFIEARNNGVPSVKLWGTGKARREFVHVDDVVRGMIFCMEKLETPEIHNLGSGDDVSIAELAETVRGLIGFKGAIEWDASKPEGMPRKCMNVDRLKALGFSTKKKLSDGIREVIAEFESLHGRK